MISTRLPEYHAIMYKHITLETNELGKYIRCTCIESIVIPIHENIEDAFPGISYNDLFDVYGRKITDNNKAKPTFEFFQVLGDTARPLQPTSNEFERRI